MVGGQRGVEGIDSECIDDECYAPCALHTPCTQHTPGSHTVRRASVSRPCPVSGGFSLFLSRAFSLFFFLSRLHRACHHCWPCHQRVRWGRGRGSRRWHLAWSTVREDGGFYLMCLASLAFVAPGIPPLPPPSPSLALHLCVRKCVCRRAARADP